MAQRDDSMVPGASPRAPRSPDLRAQKIRREPNRLRRLGAVLGPGFITGASDDDPSGIGTATVAGASFGFATLWSSVLAFPMMAVAQFLSAKLGLVAGHGLARLLRDRYSRALLYPVVGALVIANTITIGADLIAAAATLRLFVPVPVAVLMFLLALVMVVLILFGSYELIARVFKWLALALFAYVGAAVLARPDPLPILKSTVLPAIRWDKGYFAILLAILGTCVTPYMLFWQSSEEVEERRAAGHRRLWQRRGASDTELKYAAWDVSAGMFFSQFVFYFIIVAAAATLFRSGKTHVETAAQAAEALRPLAGRAAQALFAIGLVGSGFLSMPVLAASNGYALGDIFGWNSSLDEKPRKARNFYLVIAGSLFAGLLVNFIGWNPISALVWASVINGFLAPPLLILLLVLTNSRSLMGKRTNGFWMNVLGWATVLAMSAAAVGLIITSLH